MLLILNTIIRLKGPLSTSTTLVLVTLTVVVWWIERRVGVVMLNTVKWLLTCLIHHVVFGLVEWSPLILNKSLLSRLIFVNFACHLGSMRSDDFSAFSLLRLVSHRGCILFIEV